MCDAAVVLVMSDAESCSCIGVVVSAVARPERRSAGHTTGAPVGGMVTTQHANAADDRFAIAADRQKTLARQVTPLRSAIAVVSLIRGPVFEEELWGPVADGAPDSPWEGWWGVGLAVAFVLIGALSIWSALRAQSRWGMLPNQTMQTDDASRHG